MKKCPFGTCPEGNCQSGTASGCCGLALAECPPLPRPRIVRSEPGGYDAPEWRPKERK